MKNLVDNIAEGARVIDNLTESAEERQATLSQRHSADMGSDNRLSKSIRPLVLLVLLVLQIIIVLLSAFGLHVDISIVTQHGVLLAGAFSFYFNSKKAERIATQNAKANIELEKIRTRHVQKKEKKDDRHERRLQRRAERKQDKED